jgi:hypothetical protein
MGIGFYFRRQCPKRVAWRSSILRRIDGLASCSSTIADPAHARTLLDLGRPTQNNHWKVDVEWQRAFYHAKTSRGISPRRLRPMRPPSYSQGPSELKCERGDRSLPGSDSPLENLCSAYNSTSSSVNFTIARLVGPRYREWSRSRAFYTGCVRLGWPF